MLESVFSVNLTLQTRLTGLVQDRTAGPVPLGPPPTGFSVVSSPGADANPATPIHVVVTANEVNHLHGTGPLVQRIFKNRRNIFSIRARNDWGGHDFGDRSEERRV